MFEFTHTFAHSEVAVPELISRISPMAVAVSLPAWLDLAAVIVGSLAGVGEASRRKLDAVGFVGLALICGLGGGLVRDIMMQRGGVYMLESPYAIPASVITGCLGFLFPHALSHVPGLLEWVDITAVALFAAVGTDKALVNGYLPASCVLMGIMTGVGGGMLRDVFLGDVPKIFQRSNLYALCAIGGAVTYWFAAVSADINKVWAMLLCVAVTIGMRRWSLHYNVMSPADVNLSPHVKRQVHRIARVVQITRHASRRTSKTRHGRETAKPTSAEK